MSSLRTSGAGLLSLLLPNLSWRRELSNHGLKREFAAAFVATLVILPQAVAFATLAGLPPAIGILAAMVPVTVAALWGSSYHAVSGPNTAVSVMVAATLVPLAAIRTSQYIELSLFLALLVGLMQLLFVVSGAWRIFRYVSPATSAGISNAVGLIIIFSALSGALGTQAVPGSTFVVRVWSAFHDVALLNPYATVTAVSTVLVSYLARVFTKRFHLLAAIVAGAAVGLGLNFVFGVSTTGMELLGRIELPDAIFSLPPIIHEPVYVLKELIVGALLISGIALMQAAVISQRLAHLTEHHIDLRRELFAQGLSNISAAFFSGFPGASSFNRAQIQVECGARTPLAAALIAPVLLVVCLLLGDAMSHVPMAVVSGVLIRVGLGLVKPADFSIRTRPTSETMTFVVVLATALLAGLALAIVVGVLLAIGVYLYTSGGSGVELGPVVDGKLVVTVRGDLFLGRLAHLEAQCAVAAGQPDLAQLELDLTVVQFFDEVARTTIQRIAHEHEVPTFVLWPSHLAQPSTPPAKES